MQRGQHPSHSAAGRWIGPEQEPSLAPRRKAPPRAFTPTVVPSDADSGACWPKAWVKGLGLPSPLSWLRVWLRVTAWLGTPPLGWPERQALRGTEAGTTDPPTPLIRRDRRNTPGGEAVPRSVAERFRTPPRSVCRLTPCWATDDMHRIL
jgi:hypothetical protein